MNREGKISEEQLRPNSYESLRTQENTYQQNFSAIRRFYQYILATESERRAGRKVPMPLYDSMKDFFRLPIYDRSDIDFGNYAAVAEMITELERSKGLLQSGEENMRSADALKYLNSLAISTGDTGTDRQTAHTPSIGSGNPESGQYFTNVFSGSTADLMQSAEMTKVRTYMSIEAGISNVRVLSDLYRAFCEDELLAENGFTMKSFLGLRTDSLIVYSGERGCARVLDIMTDYSTREGVGLSSPGVYLGVKPKDASGNPIKGISTTFDPDASTFNLLQSGVLHQALLDSAIADHQETDDLCDIDNRTLAEMRKHIADEADPWFQGENEALYLIELKKALGGEVDGHNLAFPVQD